MDGAAAEEESDPAEVGQAAVRERSRGVAAGHPGLELTRSVGLNDARKPLRSRLLAVPALGHVTLDHMRTIAEECWTGTSSNPLSISIGR